MIIQDFLEENNFIFSNKGRECLNLAIRDIYPNLPKEYTWYIYLACDLKEEECLSIINLTIRYLKLSAFS